MASSHISSPFLLFIKIIYRVKVLNFQGCYSKINYKDAAFGLSPEASTQRLLVFGATAIAVSSKESTNCYLVDFIVFLANWESKYQLA
jgi:hypothetical protein